MENHLLSCSLRLVSAAALCPALRVPFAHTSAQALQVNCFSHVQQVHGPVRLTGLQHPIHKKEHFQAHGKAWKPAVRHAGLQNFV